MLRHGQPEGALETEANDNGNDRSYGGNDDGRDGGIDLKQSWNLRSCDNSPIRNGQFWDRVSCGGFPHVGVARRTKKLAFLGAWKHATFFGARSSHERVAASSRCQQRVRYRQGWGLFSGQYQPHVWLIRYRGGARLSFLALSNSSSVPHQTSRARYRSIFTTPSSPHL